MTSEESYSDRDLRILLENTKTNVKSKINAVTCGCKNTQPGIINLDPRAYEPGCWIRNRLLTGKYTKDTSINPKNIGGYSLGVAA